MTGQTVAHYRITGKRFAVMLAPEGEAQPEAPTHVTFLLNFFDELRRPEAAGGAKRPARRRIILG